MDSHARPPRISSDSPKYHLPSISTLMNVTPESPDPPWRSPEPPLSQQRHVKQHAESLPNSSSTTHHNPAGPELHYAPPGGRKTHTTRVMPPRLESPLTQPWSLPPTRHTTGTNTGPSTFHSSAPLSHPSEHSYSARPARASYPSHQNKPPVLAPYSSAGSLGQSQEILPSFASIFGPSSARPAPQISESTQDGPQITVARSREFEISRSTASYPPDPRRESQILQAGSNSPINATPALPIYRTVPANHTSQLAIQFGSREPQHYDFRPVERQSLSCEPLAPRTQPGSNATVHQQPYPGHHTAGTQGRGISGGQPHRPSSHTIGSSRSTTAVASSHVLGYPVGGWRADYNGSHVPAMSHSMSHSRSSVPASSHSIHAPPTLPTQPNSRPVPSHPYSYEASIPLGHGAPSLNPVSPCRPSRGRGSRGRQGSRRVSSDLAPDVPRANSQPRKRPRRNMAKAFDPTPIARPPPKIMTTRAPPIQRHTGTGGVPEGTPGGLYPISPRAKHLILQTGPDDLPRVEKLLTKESNEAATRNKHMKKARPETCFGLISVARLADRMGILPF